VFNGCKSHTVASMTVTIECTQNDEFSHQKFEEKMLLWRTFTTTYFNKIHFIVFAFVQKMKLNTRFCAFNNYYVIKQEVWAVTNCPNNQTMHWQKSWENNEKKTENYPKSSQNENIFVSVLRPTILFHVILIFEKLCDDCRSQLCAQGTILA